jgi:hypothetical protein
MIQQSESCAWFSGLCQLARAALFDFDARLNDHSLPLRDFALEVNRELFERHTDQFDAEFRKSLAYSGHP